MAKDISQEPRRCSRCGAIISQIEDNIEGMDPRYRGWKQKQDYWSVALHSWTKNTNDYYEQENFSLCGGCKKKLVAFIAGE